ncbi:MAG: retroviral-like aspartic protease family protein [Nannocystaceae bacterium]
MALPACHHAAPVGALDPRPAPAGREEGGARDPGVDGPRRRPRRRSLAIGLAIGLAIAAAGSLAPLAGCFLGRTNDAAYGGHAAAESFVVEVPVTQDALVVADVELGGATRPFVVDTGAVTSLVDLRVAAELGLEARGTTPLADFEGKVRDHPVYVVPSLSIGGLELVDVGVVGVDLAWIEDFECKPVAGLLGNNALRHGALELDLGRGVVRLASGVEALPPRAGGVVSPLYPPSAIVQVAPPIAAGLIPRPFLIDTGASATIIVDRKVSRRLPVGRRIPARSFKGGYHGADRPATLELFTWPEVQVGGLDLEGVATTAGLGSNVLGHRLLRHFVVRVDDVARTITFWPGERPPSRGLRSLGLGVELHGDELLVRTLVEGSPASAAGIRWGDRILTVEGAPVAAMSRHERCLIARDLERRDAVRLRVDRDGAPREVALTRAELFPEVGARARAGDGPAADRL